MLKTRRARSSYSSHEYFYSFRDQLPVMSLEAWNRLMLLKCLQYRVTASAVKNFCVTQKRLRTRSVVVTRGELFIIIFLLQKRVDFLTFFAFVNGGRFYKDYYLLGHFMYPYMKQSSLSVCRQQNRPTFYLLFIYLYISLARLLVNCYISSYLLSKEFKINPDANGSV